LRKPAAAKADVRWRRFRGVPRARAGGALQARVQARPVARAANPPGKRLTGGKSPWTSRTAPTGRGCTSSTNSSPRRSLGGAHAAARDRVVVRVLRRQCPRREPAGASEGGRHQHLWHSAAPGIRQSGASASARRASMRWWTTATWAPAADQRRQTASTARPATSRTLPDHHLDDTRGGLGAQLPVVVALPANGPDESHSAELSMSELWRPPPRASRMRT